MTVRVYRHDDASAPAYTGQVGGLIAVLDACLVNGYGSKPSSGWAKAFSGTNLAAYRPPSGTRGYLRVDDSATLVSRVVGYMAMTDVSTGTDPFPTAAQVSGGIYLQRSNTSDATARPWVVIATDSRVYFIGYSDVTSIVANAAASGCMGQFFFGDIVSYKPGDAYHCALIGGAETNSTSSGRFGALATSFSSGTSVPSNYIARNHTQSGGSLQVGKASLGTYVPSAAPATTAPPYPDVMSGGIPLAPIEVMEPSASGLLTRGRLPGMWAPLVQMPGASGDTFDGAGELAGKAFLLLNVSSSSALGRAAFETSDTW